MSKRITNAGITERVARRQEFTANSTTGEWVAFPSSSGLLPSSLARRYWDDIDAADRAFVVRSYATPIAWWTEGTGWVVPLVKYSRTTSGAQSRVRAGAGEFVTV